MQLRLTYRGPLKSHRVPKEGDSDRMAPHVHMVRRHFHRQLREFWQTNLFLKDHQSWPSDWGLPTEPSGAKIPLVDIVAQSHLGHGFRFVPLVRKVWKLECSLSILFLRGDQPGSSLIHRGDIDNRIKTLIDSLRLPETSSEAGAAKPQNDEDPFFCLLESDEFVTGLSVETDKLLDVQPDDEDNVVSLVICAQIKPFHVNMFNQGFL